VRNVTDPTRWGASARSRQARAAHAEGTLSGESATRGPPVRQRGLRRTQNQVAVSFRVSELLNLSIKMKDRPLLALKSRHVPEVQARPPFPASPVGCQPASQRWLGLDF